MSEEKTFTQEEVNQIVSERLEREKRKREEAIEEIQAQATKDMKEEYFKVYKKSKLIEAGVKFDKADEILWMIKGESEEEIKANIAIIAPELTPEYLVDAKPSKRGYADPSQRGRRRWNPFK